MGTASDKRRQWEMRWGRLEPEEFQFHISEPPAELVKLVEEGDLPEGAAVDLGCGAGIVTAYLAEFFYPVIGLDIALVATQKARELAAQQRSQPPFPNFVVGEVPLLPFRAGAFSLVFDRGCLQHIAGPAWPRYFLKVERALKAGGKLQLYCVERQAGLRRRFLGAGERGRGPRSVSHALLKDMLPATMAILELRDLPFYTSGGEALTFTYGLFEKPDRTES